MAINPAFTGVRETFNMTALFRRKWFTIQNSPSSQTFAADGTVANGKLGIGFQALNDQTSYFTTTGFYGSLAYHLPVSETFKLSLGAQGGVNILPIANGSGVGTNNQALGSLGVGAWLYSDHFYVGISKPEVLKQSFGTNTANALYRRPLYIMTGGSYDLAEDVLLLPQLLIVQEKDRNLRADIGARFWFSEKVGIGGSYRMGGGLKVSDIAVSYFQFSAEAQIGRNVRLGYFYSTKQTEAVYYQQSGPKGVHELMLKFTPSPNGFQKY